MITTRHRIELEAFFLIALTAGASIFFVIQRNNNHQPQFAFSENLPLMQAPIEAVAPKITKSFQISSDGTKKVVMKATENSDGTTTYEFSTADEKEAGETIVFTKILDSSKSMSVPFNTWSPDNKYFFIQENIENNKKIYVFEARGIPFSAEEPYLDATDLFAKQNTGNSFDEATGWASETLIIINTKKPNGEKGFSYWFEVPSKAIIQLSTEF